MQIRKLYDYASFDRVDSPNGRKYDIEGDHLPSVTTILSATGDRGFLDDWRNAVGIEKATQITTEASTLGSAMHTNLENYIFDKPMAGSFMAKALANVIIKNGLSKVDEIWGSEVCLYVPGLYAGTTDLTGIFNGIPAIMDFKNSIREKTIDKITDYRAQLGAYAVAHNNMFQTNIRCGVIMCATRDARYQEFIFDGTDFDECIELWYSRVDLFYKQQTNT